MALDTLQTVKTELDGNAGLYGAMTDQQVVDELIVVDKSQNKTSMTRQEVYENIDTDALLALTAVQLAQLNLAMSDTIDPFGNAAQVFTNIFGSGVSPATMAALVAARVETVSRSSQIGLNIESASLLGWVTEARAI